VKVAGAAPENCLLYLFINFVKEYSIHSEAGMEMNFAAQKGANWTTIHRTRSE
jgi:hypothetical protein